MFLCKYYTVTCSLKYYQSFMRNQEENIEWQEKYMEEFVLVTSILWLQVLLLTSFLPFFFVCSFLLVYSNFKWKIFLLLKKMVGGLVPPLSPQCLRSCQILTINGKFQSLHLIKIQQHNHKNKESYHHEQIHLLTT